MSRSSKLMGITEPMMIVLERALPDLGTGMADSGGMARRFAMGPRAVLILAVGLAHIALLGWASRVTPTPPPMTPPLPLAVRWVDAPAAPPPVVEPQPAPPKPVVPPRPAPPAPRHPVVLAGRTSAPATAETPAPAVPVPAAPVPATSAAPAEPPPVIPPHVDAAYLSNPPPDYPSESRRAHEEGRVLLRVLVSADGSARDVHLEQGCGFSRLDEAALAAVRRWRFTPGRQGDAAVEAWVLIPISFKLRT